MNHKNSFTQPPNPALDSPMQVCGPIAPAGDHSAPVISVIPRPEHPRPDALRDHCFSLNGEWQFEIDDNDDGEERGLISCHDLNSKIIVPFCPESTLSGLGHTNYINRVWYRRIIELPAAVKGKRILLHFGGVDYKIRVYVNGELAGTHIGGSAAFKFEITRFLKDRANEVVVRVADDLRSQLQPGGKQAPDISTGCVYTRTTGIWQTVWLEAVGSCYVESISVVPDPEHSRVLIEVAINGADKDLTLKVEAFADGELVGSDFSAGTWRNHRLVLDLSRKELWEPGAPFLYDLKLTLTSNGQPLDELKSYFGLRTVSCEGRRVLINGKPVFQRLILDQGFYPDGIWTAPTDDALKHDILMSMEAGYNGARLHQKVFEPRFLYWADKLGYLVWGEFPNWGYSGNAEGHAPWIAEWTEVLLRDRNHPSIIGWCPSNEVGWHFGALQQVVTSVTKAIDPTRPVLETSGWTHTMANPEMLDCHDYDQNPETFRKRYLDYFAPTKVAPLLPERYQIGSGRTPSDQGVPFMVSEFGGIAWAAEGGWGYGSHPKTLEDFYARYKGLCDAQLDNPNLFGFCYTQLTDVEQEQNGLLYYNRTPKFDLKRLHEITSRQAAYERGEPVAPPPKLPVQHGCWKILVGSSRDGKLAAPFRYTTETPGEDWMKESFDDSRWASGLAPFGKHSGRPGIKTVCATNDIYLRRNFEYNGEEISEGVVVVCSEGEVEFYLNGEKMITTAPHSWSYIHYSITGALKGVLKNGLNTLVIHTCQTPCRSNLDLALLVINSPYLDI